MTASHLAARRTVRIISLLSGVAVLAAMVFAANAQAQQSPSAPEGRVVVIGEGSVSVAPDYAEINGGVTTRGKSVKEATDANSKLMAAITSALVDSGVAPKDIQTSRFSIQPLYVSPDPHGEAKLSGYNVSNQVNVTIRDIGKVGDVLDRLVAAGVTNVGNIEFLHANPSKILDQAREAAVADAKRKAEIYAKASGVDAGPCGVDHGRPGLCAADADDGENVGGDAGADADFRRRGFVARENYGWLRDRQLDVVLILAGCWDFIMYGTTIGTRRYAFADLKTLLAKASPLRSGDRLAGVAADSGEERVAAQFALADLPLATFLNEAIVPYEKRRGHPPHHRQPRSQSLCADRASDRRRLSRLAAR